MTPGETLVYASGDWEVFHYPGERLFYIYCHGSLHDAVIGEIAAKGIVDRMIKIEESVERAQGDEIVKGDRVAVTMINEGLDGEYTFLKISGSGHRVVRNDEVDITFALHPNDLMRKL